MEQPLCADLHVSLGPRPLASCPSTPYTMHTHTPPHLPTPQPLALEANALRAASRELYAPAPTMGQASRLPSPPPLVIPARTPDSMVGLVAVLWAIGTPVRHTPIMPPSAHIGSYDRIACAPSVGRNLNTHA